MPENARILQNNCPKKYSFPDFFFFLGGGACASPPVSYAYELESLLGLLVLRAVDQSPPAMLLDVLRMGDMELN